MPGMVKLRGNVEDGLIPAEKIVRVKDADGATEEITVSTSSISDNRLIASVIGTQGDRMLIELPRESASGRWRMWVNKANAVGVCLVGVKMVLTAREIQVAIQNKQIIIDPPPSATAFSSTSL